MYDGAAAVLICPLRKSTILYGQVYCGCTLVSTASLPIVACTKLSREKVRQAEVVPLLGSWDRKRVYSAEQQVEGFFMKESPFYFSGV